MYSPLTHLANEGKIFWYDPCHFSSPPKSRVSWYGFQIYPIMIDNDKVVLLTNHENQSHKR